MLPLTFGVARIWSRIAQNDTTAFTLERIGWVVLISLYMSNNHAIQQAGSVQRCCSLQGGAPPLHTSPALRGSYASGGFSLSPNPRS
jgi:hypothetical protein